MSSKFLPFVTEKSSETAVFKALLQRSKGMSYATISTLYSVIISLGIEKVREKLDSYPEIMGITEKIAEVLSQHEEYVITRTELLFWASILMHVDEKNGVKASPYNDEERSILFSVLSVLKPDKVKNAGFDADINRYVEFSKEDFNSEVHETSPVLFVSSAGRVGFTSWEDLKAFIAVNQNRDSKLEVFPVLMRGRSDNTEQSSYAEQHCNSPYTYK